MVFQAEISRNEIETGINIVDILNEKTFFKSNGEARCIDNNSISVNKEKEDFLLSTKDLINHQLYCCKVVRKIIFVIRIK
jgi:tyrosyl-tRNA synthetase